MEGFTGVGAAISLVYTVVGLVRRLSAQAWKEAVTQALAWVTGVLVAVLLAASDFAVGLNIGGVELGGAKGATVVLMGLALGSMAMAGKDILKSLDSSQSAQEPELGGPSA